MDKIDKKLLAAMEENSRISLKNLARELNVKTSTIYHRLHKLKENKILEKFTVVINPEKVGLSYHVIVIISLKKMITDSLDTMFLESFAKYLSEQYEHVLFSAVGNDELIWTIQSFKEEDDFLSFHKTLKENPYIENIKVIELRNILKGKKLFTFYKSLIGEDETGALFNEFGDFNGKSNKDSSLNTDNDEKGKIEKINGDTREILF